MKNWKNANVNNGFIASGRRDILIGFLFVTVLEIL
jgi:hypothetical protein